MHKLSHRLTMTRRRLFLRALLGFLILAICSGSALANAHKLRGLKGSNDDARRGLSDNQTGGKVLKGPGIGAPKGRNATGLIPPLPPGPPGPPISPQFLAPRDAQKGKKAVERKGTKVPGKTGRTASNSTYDYFVEACDKELVADVLNGGIIKQNQFTDFVYGYCSTSSDRGPSCDKKIQDQGFDALPDGVKLFYIKSFCPTDMEGQVACLYGMNDRGRTYQSQSDLDQLCYTLEDQLVQNGLLNTPGKQYRAIILSLQIIQKASLISFSAPFLSVHAPGDDDGNVDDTIQKQDDDQSGRDPQGNLLGPANGYGGQVGFGTPTQTPTSAPLPATFPPVQTANNVGNIGGVTPRPTSAPRITPAPGSWTSPVSHTPPPYTNKEFTPSPGGKSTQAPVNVLILNDSKGGNSSGSNRKAKVGGIVGAVMVALVGAAIVVALLMIRNFRRSSRSNDPITRAFFFVGAKLKGKGAKETNSDRGDTMCDNGTIASEEITFQDKALFESWPLTEEDKKLGKPRSSDTLSRDHLDENMDDEAVRATYSPSNLLQTFFSRSAKKGKDGRELLLTPAENAIDEIKRAISFAEWQDVYYLASKMAAEGNIDSEENLRSALVKCNDDGGDYVLASERAHLSAEDAKKAAQLDVSLRVGDWITLAARAAVFAALEGATHPVPSSISVPEDETAEICLAKVKASLEEAKRASAELYARQGPPEEDENKSENEDDNDGWDSCDDSVPKSVVHCGDEEIENKSEAPKEDWNDTDTETTRSNLPGPPSVAMSANSTIPTEASNAGDVKNTSISDSTRGPFLRDFSTGTSRPMDEEQQESPIDDTRASI